MPTESNMPHGVKTSCAETFAANTEEHTNL